MKQIYFQTYLTLFLIIFPLQSAPNKKPFSIPFVHVGSPKQKITAHRKSIFPYLSGDTFRSICNHVIDVDIASFDTANVKPGDSIFVYPYLLDFFFSNVHPNIKNPYILVTHDTDIEIPGRFLSYLNDSKIIAWFGKNCRENLHIKLHGLPIGFANAYWKHGNISTIKHIQAAYHPKKYLLYMNFSISTNSTERTFIYNYFKHKKFCHIETRQNFKSYLTSLSQSKFVLSPRGNGEDAHRTWEALAMGAIPIVKSSFIDYLFEDLPVIIITEWTQVTEEFLEKKYQEIIQAQYNQEKIYAPFWINKIKHIQQAYRKNI